MTKTSKAAIKSTATVLCAQKHYETMLAIAAKAATWHSTSYKKANDELYALLSDCYSSLGDIRSQGTATVRALNEVLTQNGITFNDGTSLETKVVRVVFGNIGKRAHIYARVLGNAAKQGVKPAVFSEWLAEQGGVEAVRKQVNGLTPAQVKAQSVAKAEKALPLVKEKQLTNAPKMDGSDYVIAIVQHANGKPRIVGFCENLTLVKQVLAKAAEEAEKQAVEVARADLERKQREFRQQIAAATTFDAVAA